MRTVLALLVATSIVPVPATAAPGVAVPLPLPVRPARHGPRVRLVIEDGPHANVRRAPPREDR